MVSKVNKVNKVNEVKFNRLNIVNTVAIVNMVHKPLKFRNQPNLLLHYNFPVSKLIIRSIKVILL